MVKIELYSIDVPNAPDNHALNFPRYFGEADIYDIIAITNLANRADNIYEYEVAEEVMTQYKNLRNTDMKGTFLLLK